MAQAASTSDYDDDLSSSLACGNCTAVREVQWSCRTCSVHMCSMCQITHKREHPNHELVKLWGNPCSNVGETSQRPSRELPNLQRTIRNQQRAGVFRIERNEGDLDEAVLLIARSHKGKRLWTVCGAESCKLVCCSMKGKIMSPLPVETGFPVNGLCRTSNGNLLVTCYGKLTIFLLKKAQKKETFTSFCEVKHQPICISSDSAGEAVFVCLKKVHVGNDIYFLQIDNNTGAIIKEIKPSSTLKLSIPYKMTIGHNGQIIFTDKYGFGRGKIVCLESNGELLFTYGERIDNFNPSGIIAVGEKIYTINVAAAEVHVINMHGKLLQKHRLSIGDPECIDSDNQGWFYIGGKDRGFEIVNLQ